MTKREHHGYRDELDETQVQAEEQYRIDSRHREVEDTAAGSRTFHPLNDNELAQRRLRRGVRLPDDKEAA